MRERGLSVAHGTVFRWVQRYAPELNRRMRPHLKMKRAIALVVEVATKIIVAKKHRNH
jgi:transposase-like protein